MAASKRHRGGLVGGVAVAVALLLLWTAAPALAVTPTISSFTPSSGPAGCVVTIIGTNFNNPNVTSVTVGGDPQPAFTIVSGTELRVTLDAGAATGTIVVDNGASATSASTFTVANPGTCSPSITSLNPNTGPVGTAVTIFGSNLLGVVANGVKFFNNVNATFVEVSQGQLSAFVPSGATTGPVTVQTAVGTSAGVTFTVGTGPVPTISLFNPTQGPVGTSVVITGTNFTNVTSVSFNNVNATSYTVNSSTQITATVPTGATTGPIRVNTASGTATSPTSFTVTAAPLPTITSFTPTFGPTGKVVTITGTNFSGTGFTTTSVKFNNVTATFTVNSATQITATVPSTATTGKITVTTPGGTATSTADFVVSVVHDRTVSLTLGKHLVAKGEVSAGSFSACAAAAEVKIQRLKSGNWKTVGTDTASSNGAFKTSLDDKTGKYRAVAPKVSLGGGANVCAKAVSPSKKHNH